MAAPFELIASHLALDFVNTLDDRFEVEGRKELLPRYAELLAFMEQSRALDARDLKGLRRKTDSVAAQKALRHAHELRETLAAVLYAIVEKGKPPRDSLKQLEGYFVEAYGQRELLWKQMAAGNRGGQATWKWAGTETNLDLPVWVIALAAADLLTSRAIDAVHECASPTCRWLFLDTSKNHSRRWCDMKICGNRMKARRFQARQ